ncbi:phosphatidate cytidylyltransferase [Rhodanobacter sp. DHG33]|uniref:phosphatidate cytidylyltransferase n=1 Tax=Rhodanobacter sp. DHG33 TaxID=2775921 RepID=UPI001785A129|nr:phosphatidate cytidylyltransferase [Rhodanobacter sp. DHG33]MBD8900114.1 phosphatidate cytidylyltransferase [Rhodanobacter sp. DHG33]
MLRQRVFTALLLAPLAIAIILLLPTAWFALVIAVVFLGALEEWTHLAGVQKPAMRMAWLVLAAVLFTLLWLLRDGASTLLLGLGVAWWLVACLWLRHFAFGAAPTPENRALKLAAGAFVVFPAWMASLVLHGRESHGHWWVLLALVIVWAADIGAYFSGRSFGKRKLAPQISPGKTWAGAYGAMVAGVLVALAGGWLLDVRGMALFGLGVLATLTVAISIVGDLLESLMKRHAGIKDSGSIFPGHGGLLDRLDSVFAALPVFALGLRLLGL